MRVPLFQGWFWILGPGFWVLDFGPGDPARSAER